MSKAMPRKFTLKSKDFIQTPDGKKTYNEEHFNEAARHYDFATKAMSLGRDLAWKKQLIAALPTLAEPCCVDLACGTGDITCLLAERYPGGRIVGIDLTAAMLELARTRNRAANVEFIQGDMAQTQLPSNSVDIVTGSYAIRNAPELVPALAEIQRILKPGGSLALLDFSKPPGRIFQRCQYLVLKYWCGLWGLLLHGNPEVHSYIAASLKEYPDRERLQALLNAAGFTVQRERRFYLGTLQLLVLQKKIAASRPGSINDE